VIVHVYELVHERVFHVLFAHESILAKKDGPKLGIEFSRPGYAAGGADDIVGWDRTS